MLHILEFVGLIVACAAAPVLLVAGAHWAISGTCEPCAFCEDRRTRLHNLPAAWFCRDCGWTSNHENGEVKS
jgi:hypothetical protein